VAFDIGLAERTREFLRNEPGVFERKMFGGLVFMLDGNLALGVYGEGLIVRVGRDAYEASLRRQGAGMFDFTGKPMRNWVVVDSSGLEDDAVFEGWVTTGLTFARSLPPRRGPDGEGR